MSNTGLIVGVIFLVLVVGGGFMFRKQIQAFIEKHTSSSGDSGSPKVDENEEALNCYDACSGGEKRADECMSCVAAKSKMALAYTAAEVNSYT
jgi:hypothetical protein